jgi:hypothetical protein
LYIYNHALGTIQGYEPPKSFIIGRGFKYKSKSETYSSNNCFTRVGHIIYDDWDNGYIKECLDAINWIKKLRLEGKEWKLLPEPSIPQLYPNMSSAYESQWDNFKLEYAKKIGDITMLWNCGFKNRVIAHSNGIYSWRDQNCVANKLGIMGSKQGPLLDRIIKINQKSDFKDPLDCIQLTLNPNVDNRWRENSKLTISVDFETINNVVDDLTSLPYAQDTNYLFMIGVGWTVNSQFDYKVFTISELSKNAEFQMIYQFYTFLRNLTDQHLGENHYIPPLYHWGHIERSFFEGLCLRLVEFIGNDVESDIEIMRTFLDWFDLLECFKENPIVINGCFKFGLKEVATRLHQLGLIENCWSQNPGSCNNGNTAMVMAYKAYMSAKSGGLAINQSPIMKEIVNYNRIDCYVIHQIINVLRQKLKSLGK